MMMEQKLHLEIVLPITVGDNVWIGTNVSVLPGVTYFRTKLYCMLLLVGKSIFLSRMSDGKRCSGSIPYGYNRLPEDKQTLVVDPVASQVVKHIFELAAEGLTPPAIARQLTEEKVLIPSAYTLQYHPEQCNRKAEYGCTNWNANTENPITRFDAAATGTEP